MEIQEKQQSFAKGIVGALLGGLLGGVSIILLGQMGIVASLSGVLLAFCTLKGFALLGGKLNKPALLVCVVIMLAVPYLADRLSWAIAYYQFFQENEMALSFGDAFQYVYDFLELDELMGEYWKNLLFVYAFTAIGAFTILKQQLKQKSIED